MNRTEDPVADYLNELERELAALPKTERREILEEVTEHIAAARSENGESEAAVRNALEQLGPPNEIADEARSRFGIEPVKAGWREGLALALLAFGGFFWLIGWPIGVWLLWSSKVWTRNEKLIGTFVVPGGLAVPFYMFSRGVEAVCPSPRGGCSGGASTLYEVVLMASFVLTLAMLALLIVRLRRRTRAA